MSLADRLESAKPAILRTVGNGVLRLPRPVLKTMAGPLLEPVDGKTLALQFAVMLRMASLMNGGDLTAESPSAARKGMKESIQIVASPPLEDVSSRDFEIPGPAGAIPARLYEPDEINPTSALVMFMHGGGWVVGDIDTHDTFCRLLASKANVRVVSIDYRLAPEHPFPAGPDDCVAAFRWLAEHAQEFGADAGRIAVMGDSAGGNLAAVIGWETRDEAIKPALQVLVYPGTSGVEKAPSRDTYGKGYLLSQDDIDWFLGHYMSEGMDPKDPRFAPLFAKDLKGAPQSLVYTAGFNPLIDEGKAYETRLRDAGVKTHYRCFDSLTHGFINMEGACTAAAKAVDVICADVGATLRAQYRKREKENETATKTAKQNTAVTG